MSTSTHNKQIQITLADIGAILKKINDCEISFRFENLVAIGYRWAVVGYPESNDAYDIILKRAEIDDAIDGARTITAIDEFHQANNELHIQQRDWFERGSEDEDIVVAIRDLANSICRVYPDSDFTKWYLNNYLK
jgi:hypothetical protein